jgi:hypothetical protein
VFVVSPIGVFQIKVYKIGSCYSARKTKKEKSVLCDNLVIFILMRSQYVLYRDDELIFSPMLMWLPPQPCR